MVLEYLIFLALKVRALRRRKREKKKRRRRRKKEEEKKKKSRFGSMEHLFCMEFTFGTPLLFGTLGFVG